METKRREGKPKGLSRRKFLKIAGAAGAVAMVPAPFVHAKKKLTLRVINQEPDPNTLKFFEKAFAEYEEKTGIKVMLDTVPGGEAFPKLAASIKAGNPYHIGNMLVAGNIMVMAGEGWLMPLTGMIKRIGMDDFGPNILFPMKGEVWWYPYDYNFAHWFYRTDVFKEKGLKPPKTWGEFVENAKACTVDKNNDGIPDMYGAVLGIGNGQWVDWLGTGFMWAEGVKFFDDDWNVIFDGPEMKPKVVAYLKFFKDLYGYMPPGMTQIVWGDHIKHFLSERVAMAPYCGRFVHHVDRYAPHLADKFGAFAYPSSDGSQFAIGHGYDGWVIPKTKYAKEAEQFLEWLVTEKIIDFYATLPVHYQPTRLSIYEDPRWKNLPLVQKYWDITQEMKSFLTRKDIVIDMTDLQGPEIDPRPGKISRKFVIPTMLQSHILKGLPPEQCVDTAANTMREVMKE